ncbi:pyruvate formate-lyase [Vibrio ponticus]|nr:pyruvate formate-lyase [Vibrio ponticus]
MSSKIENNPSQVDVNKKIPCEKPASVQLNIMERTLVPIIMKVTFINVKLPVCQSFTQFYLDN